MFKEIGALRIHVEEDRFNSEHFGIRMGNMDISPVDPYANISHLEIGEALEEAIAATGREGYQHLTCKTDPGCKPLMHGLESKGFLLVDTLVTYQFDFAKASFPSMVHRCEIRESREDELDRLKDMTRKAFKIDRFHSDPALSNELCDTYYTQWLENSYHGFADKMFSAYLNGELVGFITGKYVEAEDSVRPVLAAVSEKARGFGVYTSMIYEIMCWAREKAKQNPDVKGLLVGTQVNNLAVQKAWINLGYTVYGSTHVFQRMI